MYDRDPKVFTVNKNDAQYLDQFQINKAKYWFHKFIDIYNNGFISWSDIEFQLSHFIRNPGNLETFKKFYKSVHAIWTLILNTYEKNEQNIRFEQFLNLWGALYNHLKKNDSIPDIFLQLFHSTLDICEETEQIKALRLNLKNIDYNYTIEPGLNDIIKLVKEFIISDNPSSLSYSLVPGLESYLNHYNFATQKENSVSKFDERSLNYKDDAAKLSRSTESNYTNPFSPFSTSSSLESCHYYSTKSYEHQPLQKFSFSESSENVNDITLSEDTLVLKSCSQLTVTSESLSVESTPKKHGDNQKSGNQYQYFVDENLTEEEVLNHIINLHKAEITDFEKIDNIKYTVETRVDEKEKNQQQAIQKSISTKPLTDQVPVENLRSMIYQEYQNMMDQEYIDQTPHRSRSTANFKNRGYHREFKRSKEREFQRSSSRNSINFSRGSIHEEFKRSKARLNSIEKSSSNERTSSYSRSNFRQEFKKGRNQNINNYPVDPEIDDDIYTSTSATNRINTIMNKEFKRSKTRINSRRIFDQDTDQDIDESKNSLNLYESINEIDIKNRNIENHRNQKYMQEFKKSPINFPRSEDRSIRMNRPTQLRYGFDENQQPSHAYSTQSLPAIDDDQFNTLLEEESSKQTLSLDESGKKITFQGSSGLNRTLLNKIHKTKVKNGCAETKIGLEMLDKEELKNLKNLLNINNIISSEINSEMQENPVNKDVSSKQKRSLLRQVLQELKEEYKQQKDKKSKIKRDDLWKKLKVCLDNDGIYVFSNGIAVRSKSPDTAVDEEDNLLVKILDLLRPMIREMVREEVKKCISELLSSS